MTEEERSQETELSQLRAVKRAAKEQFGHVAGVTGFGIGNHVIRIYVSNPSILRQLPKMYRGVRVDYVLAEDIASRLGDDCDSELTPRHVIYPTVVHLPTLSFTKILTIIVLYLVSALKTLSVVRPEQVGPPREPETFSNAFTSYSISVCYAALASEVQE